MNREGRTGENGESLDALPASKWQKESGDLFLSSFPVVTSPVPIYSFHNYPQSPTSITLAPELHSLWQTRHVLTFPECSVAGTSHPLSCNILSDPKT